ncbi:hypothetical protein ACE6H2_001644 [Prunus campanulata]
MPGVESQGVEWPAKRVRDTFMRFFEERATLTGSLALLCLTTIPLFYSPLLVYKLPEDRICATYFGGDEKGGLAPDNEARDIWLKFLPPARVLPFWCKSKMSNYDTDVFMPIFDAIQQATGAWPYSGKVGLDDVDKVDMAYRVVADHIGTLSLPLLMGNDGLEYVLRRILRRAVRNGNDVLKAKEGFFNGLVGILVTMMGDVFPEVKQHEAHIGEIIKEEEETFEKTLQKGIERFRKAAQDVEGKTFSGQDAFVLWDTYGFALDLTQLIAEERGLLVDVEGFNNAMDEARERSRNAQNKQAGGAIVMDADATAALHKSGVAATDDSFKFIWCQIFDTGSLEGSSLSFQVCNVQIYGGFGLHIGTFSGESGKLSVGDKVNCKVDYNRRTLIVPNHTCMHMLNFALREVLGSNVDQKGSIVLPEKLRFDFSHDKEFQGLISNTREAKAFALLSEEGIAKGIRRITAVTTDGAFKAIELAHSLEQEVDEASKAEGSLLEKVVANKAEIRAKIAVLQNQVRKVQKIIAEQNMQNAVKVATEMAEVAASDGKAYCVSHVDVGLDAAAVREAVVKVIEKKGMPAMVFSTDETTNKAVVCAGVPGDKGNQLEVSEWLTASLGPLKGRCGKGKGAFVATGQEQMHLVQMKQ